MSESLFKFKKAEVKKVGGFDVNDKHEWTLLVKPQYQDVTSFIHFHRLWNVPETPEVVDANGETIEKAVKAQPAFQYNLGFIKDDKFIVTQQKTVQDQTFHGIHKKFINTLTNALQDGFLKDWNCYKLDVPQAPSYHINEKTSQKDAIMQQIAAMATQQKAAGNNIPVGSPILGKRRSIKFPKNVRLGVPTTINSNNP